MAKKEYKKPLVYVQKQEKKEYYSPKATVYKAEKKPKSNNSTKSGGVRFSASTTVFGAVSLLLMIGLIATVFFAYDNSQRTEGEPFAYFSPAVFLDNLSSDTFVLSGYYDVKFVKRWNGASLYGDWYRWYGEITFDGKTLLSLNYQVSSALEELETGSLFIFVIDGERFTAEFKTTTDSNGNVIYTVDDNDFWEQTVKIDKTVELYVLPSFSELADVWSSVGDDVTFWDALSSTGRFIMYTGVYYQNIFTSLLPWNSVAYSDEVPIDKTAINIPWRNSDGSIKITTN